MSEPVAHVDGAEPVPTELLNFRAAADAQTTSWLRADPTIALVEHVAGDKFEVMLRDGARAHTVRYHREHGGYAGSCDCKGFEFRDEPGRPCAHLCTLRKAEFGHLDDVGGRRIRADPTPDLVADGGRDRYAAGADGRRFGRPSQRE